MKQSKSLKLFTFLIAVFSISLFITGTSILSVFSSSAEPTPPVPKSGGNLHLRIEDEIKNAIQHNEEDVLIYLLNEILIENIKISTDGKWALAWLTPLDPETGQIVPAEPGLVIINLQEDPYAVALPSDPEWFTFIQKVPSDILPEQLRNDWILKSQQQIESTLGLGPYGGYYLPFAGGETLYLTQSVKHDAYTPSGDAHYAFDFARPGYPSAMFNVHAAKGGRVYKVAWTYANGNSMYSNLLVLEDTTTEPTTYQLYLHLAQDSIPEEFRVKGAYVAQGQFIGVADDTGASSGNHLHFQVHTNPASYWGRSVDITFEDVLINGGRPRYLGDLKYCKNDSTFQDVCDETSYNYTSRNYPNPDYIPPTGDIASPAYGEKITSDSVKISGWANDEGSGLKDVQIIAKYNAEWHPVGEKITSTEFSISWDLCSAYVPDGPVTIALRIEDNQYNPADGLPGLTHFLKDYSCPPLPPTCNPSKNEIALFSEPDYVGECTLLGVGDHTTIESLGDVGENNAESILVGSDIMATFFLHNNLTGRGDTFLSNDSNLADNRIGADTISSVKIQNRQATPRIPSLIWPNYSAVYDQDETISYSVDNPGGATQFQFRINISQGNNLDSPWLDQPFWNLHGLQPGNFTWQARSKNENATSEWSSFRYFYITNSGISEYNVEAPFTDNMEGLILWKNSGFWRITDQDNHSKDGSKSWVYNVDTTGSYETGSPNSGHLTSPKIQIPSSGSFFLRFWYNYQTEENNFNWDQRSIQVSVDGGPFVKIFQLSDDTPNAWKQSPAISLAGYTGKTVQFRFYFSTLDEEFNNYKGWLIDDFSITNDPPPNCSDSDGDPSTAVGLDYGEAQNGLICPGGDIDFYRLTGSAGDQIGVILTPDYTEASQSLSISLLDEDGKSLLAQNLNIETSESPGSNLVYKLKRDGLYYLKVKSIEHPTIGNQNQKYSIIILNDNKKPSIKFLYPQQEQQIPVGPIIIRVDASDTISGISHVDFYWHNSDWMNSDWTLLGRDGDGSDGWEIAFNIPQDQDPSEIAFFARAYDWAGNVSVAANWADQGATLYFPNANSNE